eukprot:5797565-Pyramimonas_sp.AAC.1
MSEVEKDNEDVESRGGSSSNSGYIFAEMRKIQPMMPTSFSSAAREAAEGVRQDIKAVDSKVTAVDSKGTTVDSKVTAHAQILMDLEQK